MKRSLMFFAAVALGLAAAPPSQADPSYITVSWTMPGGSQTLTGTNFGTVTITPEAASNSLTDVVTHLGGGEVTSLATDGPSVISASSGTSGYAGANYQETANITETYNNGAKTSSAAITFYGLMTGNISSQSSGGVNLSSALLSSNVLAYSIDGGAIHTMPGVSPGNPLGGVSVNLFDVSANLSVQSFTDVNASQLKPGELGYTLTPSPLGTKTGGGTPEPSSIVLGCMGLSCLGGVFWRARRRKAAEALKPAV